MQTRGGSHLTVEIAQQEQDYQQYFDLLYDRNSQEGFGFKLWQLHEMSKIFPILFLFTCLFICLFFGMLQKI